MTLEICCPTIQSVYSAYAAGAARVELCSALELDGLTPSVGMVMAALDLRTRGQEEGRKFAVNVLVRPRPSDFVYSQEELKVMSADIEYFKARGVDGVVIGALTPDGDIDMDAMAVLMRAAEGMSVTFHRAFDHGRNPQKMLSDIIELGCDRLLTSGCAKTAAEGAEQIRRLVERSTDKLSIMAGAGVTPDNAPWIIDHTGVDEIHASARGRLETMKRLSQIISRV